MSEITRYEPDVIETNDLEDYADCVPAINGEYVRYEDHARLLAEEEAEVERRGKIIQEWMRVASIHENPHASEVLRLVGELVTAHDHHEKHHTEASATGYMNANKALLAAARKMKEQP